MTDVQALERYAETGDPDAFRHLVTCYQRLVYAACARRLRGQSDIEDAVQETFLKLAQHADRIKTSVSGWLYTTATRVCLDRVRRDQTRKRHELAWRPEAEDEGAESYAELLTAVDDALADLPDKHREVLVQYFLEGKTQTALAEEVGVTQSAIARRVERAVKELRSILDRRGVKATAGGLAAFFVADAVHAAVPGALTVSLTKLGLGGAGVASTATTGGGGALAWLAQASVPAKLAAGLGVAGATAAVTVAVLPDPDPDPDPASVTPVVVSAASDPASAMSLEGTWDGVGTNDEDTALCYLRFSGDEVTYSEPPNGVMFKGTVTSLDPDADPPRMDVLIEQSSVPQFVGMPYRAIYRFKGPDVMEIAIRDPAPDVERPTGFAQAGKDGVVLLQMKRRAVEAGPVASGADPGADHGLLLVPIEQPETLALVREARLTFEQVAEAHLVVLVGLIQTVEAAAIEVTGQPYTIFADPEVDDQGVERYPFTFAVPVAWEEEVPDPYEVKTLPAFVGVAYTLVGTIDDLGEAWPKVFEQAVHDGHDITGAGRLDTLRWMGPASDQNLFMLQIEVKPGD